MKHAVVLWHGKYPAPVEQKARKQTGSHTIQPKKENYELVLKIYSGGGFSSA